MIWEQRYCSLLVQRMPESVLDTAEPQYVNIHDYDIGCELIP